LPTLRADFSLLETYQYREEPALAWPISVLVGTMILKHPKTNLPHGSSTQQKPSHPNVPWQPFLHQHCQNALLEEINPDL